MKKIEAQEAAENVKGLRRPPAPEFKGYMDPISNSVEQKVWIYINILADAALGKYKSTLEKDNELL